MRAGALGLKGSASWWGLYLFNITDKHHPAKCEVGHVINHSLIYSKSQWWLKIKGKCPVCSTLNGCVVQEVGVATLQSHNPKSNPELGIFSVLHVFLMSTMCVLPTTFKNMSALLMWYSKLPLVVNECICMVSWHGLVSIIVLHYN